ncbi:MAG: hypothetical protein K0Q55_256 [Verrucomicrobia bacterium]|nr:hypothetical protein [Verrucomicrobiota bacterium]
MLPSCGWSQEMAMVEIGPMFRRSISGNAMTSSMNFWSFVMALTARL